MRRDVQEIFRLTPHEKQCMMFSATLSKEIRPVCRKFMQDVSRVRRWPTACSSFRPLAGARAVAAPRHPLPSRQEDAGGPAQPSFPPLGLAKLGAELGLHLSQPGA